MVRVSGRRVLVTGLASSCGGRVAQVLERDPGVEVVVGLDTRHPTVALERTEFVRADESYSILSRLVRATGVDTVLHASLVVDSTTEAASALHEVNVIGTMNLLAAASAPDSTVGTVVVASSSLVYGSAPEDPVWFTETTPRSRPPRTPVERSLLEAEGYLADLAEERPDIDVAVLRCCDVLGSPIRTPISRALELPLVPGVAGFDPQVQFVDEDDVVRALVFALDHHLGGVWNVAGDGLLPWSEVAAMCGHRLGPLPVPGTALAAAALRRLGVVDLPPELLELLRYGRGVDNGRLVQAGFRYRCTSAGAVERSARAARLRATVGQVEPPYRYQGDVEAFFRHSPAVRDRGLTRSRPAARPGQPAVNSLGDTGWPGFSMGARTRLPHSVHEPS